tara:strand:+ start:63 stop:323 length:261 start_codon:yes stop_codon:yes gene_type:complete
MAFIKNLAILLLINSASGLKLRDYSNDRDAENELNDDDKLISSMRVDAREDNDEMANANSNGVYSAEESAIIPEGMPVSLSDASQA